MSIQTLWMIGGFLLVTTLASLTLLLRHRQRTQTQQLDELNRLVDLERQTNALHGHTYRLLLRTSQRVIQEQAQYIQTLQRQIESVRQLNDN